VDFVVEHPFTADFAATTAADFVARLRAAFPGLQAVYAGENFRFGRGREGDVAFLRTAAAAAGFSVHGAPRLGHGDAPISSSRVRELLAAGDIAAANTLLGYSYFADGVVRPGKRLGRTLGFPTLNVPWSPGLRPRLGVYAGFVAGTDGRRQPAVANYGLRPTVESGATEPRLEVHVLEATRLTEGDRLRFWWLDFLRPEQRFGGVGELRAQVERDRATAVVRLASEAVQEFPNGT
jgi:riboflavin kinase/FMN adenylyltransferase